MGTGDAQASADISASPLGKLRRRKGKLVRERTAALPGVKTQIGRASCRERVF